MKRFLPVLLVGLGIIAIVAYILCYSWHGAPSNTSQQSSTVACTMEAKQCPDGSYVGRSGPSCEFAPCPTVPTPPPQPVGLDTSAWKSKTVDGVTFKYPEKLPAQYITPQDWPPLVTVEKTGVLDCRESGSEIDALGKIEKRTINGQEYCVHTESEGAAGSTYTHTIYVTMHDGVLTSFDATLRYVQCLNYDEPKAIQCQKERSDFDLDSIVDAVISTVKQ